MWKKKFWWIALEEFIFILDFKKIILSILKKNLIYYFFYCYGSARLV